MYLQMDRVKKKMQTIQHWSNEMFQEFQEQSQLRGHNAEFQYKNFIKQELYSLFIYHLFVIHLLNKNFMLYVLIKCLRCYPWCLPF